MQRSAFVHWTKAKAVQIVDILVMNPDISQTIIIRNFSTNFTSFTPWTLSSAGVVASLERACKEYNVSLDQLLKLGLNREAIRVGHTEPNCTIY